MNEAQALALSAESGKPVLYGMHDIPCKSSRMLYGGRRAFPDGHTAYACITQPVEAASPQDGIEE